MVLRMGPRVRSLLVAAVCLASLAYWMWPQTTELAPKAVTMTAPSDQLVPRITYYNRHPGTRANMKLILERLGLTLTPLDPSVLSGYGMEESAAEAIIDSGFVKLICDSSDVIIVSDTIPDGRPLFQSLLRKNPQEHCSSYIILEATNRIDYDIKKDIGTYHGMLWKLANQTPKGKVIFTANNPLEPMDLAREALAAPKWTILRSTGASNVPAQSVSILEKNKVLFKPHITARIANELLEKKNLPLKWVDHDYGGPRTAAKYLAFLEIPYQVSVMKLYENLAHGVVMLVPSKKFFKELVISRAIVFMYWHKLLLAGDDWWKYMDYYSDDISPYIYYFDSWDHLSTLISSFASNPDPKNVREKAPKAYAQLVTKTIHGWADIFSGIGMNVTVDGERHVPGREAGDLVVQPTLPDGFGGYKTFVEWKAAYEGPLEVFKKTARKDAPPF
ncbi:hypothetical protein HDU81_000645 [Chytriomyces hyalinus]|nr:hypothetical protein HDU81_000645 [Chytriomyces hyalinus]